MFKPGWERSHGSADYPKQNFRQVGPGIPDSWLGFPIASNGIPIGNPTPESCSDIQTNKPMLQLYI